MENKERVKQPYKQNELPGGLRTLRSSPKPDKSKTTPIQKCETILLTKLQRLKSELGIISHSVQPKDKSNDFEILEFYGDAVLLERISLMLLRTKRFMNPQLLTELRVACVCNINLQRCYDQLSLEQLIDGVKPQSMKAKADIVEAIIGELAEAINSQQHSIHHHKIRTILEQLIAFISYMGEQSFFELQNNLKTKKQEPNDVTRSPSSSGYKKGLGTPVLTTGRMNNKHNNDRPVYKVTEQQVNLESKDEVPTHTPFPPTGAPSIITPAESTHGNGEEDDNRDTPLEGNNSSTKFTLESAVPTNLTSWEKLVQWSEDQHSTNRMNGR